MKSIYQDIDKHPLPVTSGLHVEKLPDDSIVNKNAEEYVKNNYPKTYELFKFVNGSLNRQTLDKTDIEIGIKFKYSGDDYFILQNLGIWIKLETGKKCRLIEILNIKNNEKCLAIADTLYAIDLIHLAE